MTPTAGLQMMCRFHLSSILEGNSKGIRNRIVGSHIGND
ncbi:Uncharacterised protein [Serratia fonticola]|nr:Uncharacterised protein [Serratia fonticola]CAI1207189.1 Uncharacterised protein [Serratia fonticola]